MTTPASQRVESPPGFRPFPPSEVDRSLPERFEDQVDRFAARPAVGMRSGSLTYAELDRAANRVAHRLLERRGERAEPVALLARQGAAAVAAVLGVLKAGKFSVPLDPGWPEPRLAGLLDASGAELVLADAQSEGVARSVACGRALDVASGAKVRDDRDAARPGLTIAPDALAYVFFTSGSTGEPKGVMDTHRNVLHNVMRYTNGLGICPDDRLSLVQSPSFSGSVSSLFGALLNGASVFPIDLTREVSRLAAWVSDSELTIYHSVPALFRLLVAQGRHLPSLRVIRLEGDRATPGDAELFQRHFEPGCVLVNGLGATECGLVRRYVVTHETRLESATLPVGYAVEGVDVDVVDEEGRAVAPGEPGEIVVRSRHLSPGYWNNPDLTAAAFEDGPANNGVRSYRTGDLGRMSADGCLEHLGRKDFEVKVRGQRVEVEAVERALVAAGVAREAVVTTRDGPGGEPRLVAFVVPAAEPPPSSRTLRRMLAETLPGATIPSQYVYLGALPLTGSGKLDRAALRSLGGAPAPTGAPFVEPRDPLERQLAELWQELLDLPRVGVCDDFQDLGGDSLLAAVLLARLEETFDREIPVSLLAENGTVEELASALAAEALPDDALLFEIGPGGPGRPFFFAHGDLFGGGLYCSRLALPLAGERPFVAVVPPRASAEGALPTIERSAAERVAAIRSMQPSGPYLVGGGGDCTAGGLLAFEIARQLADRGEEVGLLTLIGTWPPNTSWKLRALGRTTAALGAALRLGADRRSILFLRTRRALLRARGVRARVPEGVRELALRPYEEVERAYVPRRYPARLTLVWPRHAPADAPGAPDVPWRRVAREVEVVLVPGDQLGAVTTHAETLGAELRRLLERADPR